MHCCTRLRVDGAAELRVGVLINTIDSSLVIPYFSVNILGELGEEDKDELPEYKQKVLVCKMQTETILS